MELCLMLPGSNTYVKGLHTEARNSYIIWRAAGKPRDHLTRDMNITRLRFKRALRHCKLIEESARADAMANSLQQHDSFSLWKHVHNCKTKSSPLSTTVDN